MIIVVLDATNGNVLRGLRDTWSLHKVANTKINSILFDPAIADIAYFPMEIFNSWHIFKLSLSTSLAAPVTPSFYLYASVSDSLCGGAYAAALDPSTTPSGIYVVGNLKNGTVCNSLSVARITGTGTVNWILYGSRTLTNPIITTATDLYLVNSTYNSLWSCGQNRENSTTPI